MPGCQVSVVADAPSEVSFLQSEAALVPQGLVPGLHCDVVPVLSAQPVPEIRERYVDPVPRVVQAVDV